ncbi:MAG: GAF domain-containing SpoIIE family protein phosphatase [Candidatus Acidiferrales bacterium]
MDRKQALAVAPAQETSDERRKLEILLRISKSLGQEIQLDPLLKLIVAEVTAAMQAERTTLFLVNREKPNELLSRVAEELDSQKIRVPFGFGIAGTTAQTREIINIADAYNDTRFNSAFDKSSGFRTRSVLSMPILNQTNQLVGVVQVLNKKSGGAFTGEDERFLDAISVHLGIALDRAEMVEAYLQSEIVRKSLELAKEIQMGLIPKDFSVLPEFGEFEIFARIVPAFEVGGDFYDFFPLDAERVCFIIGDVSGKGVPAALFMAMVRTAFKMSAIASPQSVSVAMSRVNQFLCESNPRQMFVTAFAGILDRHTGRVVYTDAGHEPPCVLGASGKVARLVDKVGGTVLGLLPDETYPGGTIDLDPGDALVLYTDGVSEAMNSSLELFGAEAIQVALGRVRQPARSETIIQMLLDDVSLFVGNAKQSDDITTLVIKYLGGGQ